MKENKFYLAWQNPDNRKWFPVGMLTLDEGVYRFLYTKGALKNSNFVCFGRMGKLDAVYESETLFPLFSNRLLSSSRPEFKNYLNWLNIKNGDQLDVLAITEGLRSTDTLEVFKCPMPNERGEYEVEFLSHGLSHLPQQTLERVNRLQTRDRLFLIHDFQNKHDPMAIVMRTDDPIDFCGYCPRYLNPDFHILMKKSGAENLLVEVVKVNVEAPLNMRLLCKITAKWPKDFTPCSEDNFHPVETADIS